MGNAERVILIEGSSSNWYKQAIFIVNPNLPQSAVPIDLVREAERIVQSYMAKESITATPIVEKTPKQKPFMRGKNKALDFALNAIMIVCCVALAGLLLYAFR